MNLNSQQCHILSKIMMLQASDPEATELRRQIGPLLLRLLNADTFTSMVWNETNQRFGQVIGINEPEERIRSWQDYYQFRDPVTRPMMQRRSATVATQVICEQELLRTEFYNDFLRPHGQHWGINIYFYSGETCVGDFRLWRKRQKGNFIKNDVAILDVLQLPVASILSRSVSVSAAQAEIMMAVLPAPTSFALTEREEQVAACIAEGLQDKSIARRLQITSTTVRYHLSNILRKTGTTNRTMASVKILESLNRD